MSYDYLFVSTGYTGRLADSKYDFCSKARNLGFIPLYLVDFIWNIHSKIEKSLTKNIDTIPFGGTSEQDIKLTKSFFGENHLTDLGGYLIFKCLPKHGAIDDLHQLLVDLKYCQIRNIRLAITSTREINGEKYKLGSVIIDAESG